MSERRDREAENHYDLRDEVVHKFKIWFDFMLNKNRIMLSQHDSIFIENEHFKNIFDDYI